MHISHKQTHRTFQRSPTESTNKVAAKHVSVCVFFFLEATEGEAQDMTPVLVNGSPKLPRLPMPSAMDHESFDITLHRKDTEGFGFVILTSKSKPPYGGGSL